MKPSNDPAAPPMLTPCPGFVTCDDSFCPGEPGCPHEHHCPHCTAYTALVERVEALAREFEQEAERERRFNVRMMPGPQRIADLVRALLPAARKEPA